MDEYNGYFRIVTTIHHSEMTVEPHDGEPPEGANMWHDWGWDGSRDSRSWHHFVELEDFTEISTNYWNGRKTTHISNSSNALYVLDMNLNILGSVENVAPGERVYSARFMGDIGYFVTFREVDPLFAVDLADPRNPVILSELKMPGFSDYLHPFMPGLMFGLGMEVCESTLMIKGLKLSMFDIDDPTDVVEIDKLVLDNLFWSEASHNHRAILVDAGRDIIAFPVDGIYYVYGYSRENGFELRGEINLRQHQNDWWWGSMRGLYIGDYLYVFNMDSIASYSLTDFTNVDFLRLDR